MNRPRQDKPRAAEGAKFERSTRQGRDGQGSGVTVADPRQSGTKLAGDGDRQEKVITRSLI